LELLFTAAVFYARQSLPNNDFKLKFMSERLEQFNSFPKENKTAPVKSENRFKGFTAGNELMVDTIIAKKEKKWWMPDFINKSGKENVIRKIQEMTEKKKNILIDYERKKSPDEARLIDLANKITNEIIKNYSNNNFNILADDIHIIKLDKKGPLRKKTNFFQDNYNNKLEQCIIIGDINEDEKAKRLCFFVTLCHEIFHAKSYATVGVIPGSGSLILRQIGVFFENHDERYFESMNEALTEKLTELAMDYLYEHSGDEEIANLFGNLIQESKSKREDGNFLSGRIPFVFKNDAIVFDKDHKNDPVSQRLRRPHYVLPGPEHAGSIKYTAYIFERFILDKLIEKICGKTGKDEIEVNKIFLGAYFDGKIGRLKKIIDESFGVGTFEKIGPAYSDLRSNDDIFSIKAKRIESVISKL